MYLQHIIILCIFNIDSVYRMDTDQVLDRCSG